MDVEIRDLRAVAGKPYGSGPVKICCPFHADITPSLAVYPDHAWCYGGCGYIAADRLLEAFSKDADSLPLFTGELDPVTRKPKVSGGTLDYEPPSLTLVGLWYATLTKGPRRERLEWLYSRGISHESIRECLIGHDGTHFTIPVLSRGRVLGVKRRRDDMYCDPDTAKYTAPYGQPGLVYRPKPKSGPVIVCEGELDALAVSQYGFDGVTTTAGSSHLPSLLRKAGLTGIVLVAPDADSAGDAAFTAILDTNPQAIRLTFPKGKDITEALLAVPEGRRANALRHWVAKAKEEHSGC
jgi:hypothetical protein